jgi:NTE family protein
MAIDKTKAKAKAEKTAAGAEIWNADRPPPSDFRVINLALQGGGAHGAFTWGVLDRLLADKRIFIEGISGTSAGAMNGALLAYGMMNAGREGARTVLRTFWEKTSEAAKFSPFQPSVFDRWAGNHNLDYSPAYQAFDFVTRLLSPYQLNPTGYHPVRDLLDELIDFEALRQVKHVRLFISTTNVRTGKIRVFPIQEISAEVLLASACLPHLFQAVEIEGEHYWDGGYMGNPAMFPLLYQCKANDIMLVEINPIRIAEVPQTARGIVDRMNSISFNATMMREMRTIAFVTQMLDQHRLTGRSHLRRIFFHMVQAEKEMAMYGASSKFNVHADFIDVLFKLGYRVADTWLEQNYDKLGTESSIDLQHLFF